MKLVISLILNVIFAIALIVSLYFLRDENYRRLEHQEEIEYTERAAKRAISEERRLRIENDELKAELEKNIAARSRLKEMLAEARRSAPKPTTLFSERMQRNQQLKRMRLRSSNIQ